MQITEFQSNSRSGIWIPFWQKNQFPASACLIVTPGMGIFSLLFHSIQQAPSGPLFQYLPKGWGRTVSGRLWDHAIEPTLFRPTRWLFPFISFHFQCQFAGASTVSWVSFRTPLPCLLEKNFGCCSLHCLPFREEEPVHSFPLLHQAVAFLSH